MSIRFLLSHLPVKIESVLYKIHSSYSLDIFKKIYNEYERKELSYYDICNLNIQELLLRLSRLQTASPDDEAFLKLIREIDAAPMVDRSVQEMADCVSYSYDHFRHKFKKMTGQPPTAYIISKRIVHSCELLINTAQTCTEIAQSCGFSTSAQFSSQFRRYVGVTPVAYRCSYQGLD